MSRSPDGGHLGEEPRGVDNPSVAVELMLVGGAVADPDGPAVGIAGPIVEHSFVARMFAVKASAVREDARSVEPAGVQKPSKKLACFSCFADAEKCADADARVAWPRESIVPVADCRRGLRATRSLVRRRAHPKASR